MVIYDGELYDYIYDDIRGELVFDIGSNIGQMVRRFVSVGAKVVAVEPQMELTTHENYDGVFAIRHTCISDEIGETAFYKCERHTSSSCRSDWNVRQPKKKWIQSTSPTTTLDALIDEFGKPKYIKIDVEGYEPKVLRGLSHKVDLISFEFVNKVTDYALECIDIIEDKFGFQKLIPFIKKKVKLNGKTVKLNAYTDEFYNKDGLVKYFNKDFPKLIKQANRDVGDILVVL